MKSDVGVTEWQLTLGALLLFLTNVIGIVIAASITFVVAGFVPGRSPLRGHTPILRAVGWAAIAAIIVVLPMQFGRGNVLPQLDPTDGVVAFVEEYVADTAAEVVDVEISRFSGYVRRNQHAICCGDHQSASFSSTTARNSR